MSESGIFRPEELADLEVSATSKHQSGDRTKRENHATHELHVDSFCPSEEGLFCGVNVGPHAGDFGSEYRVTPGWGTRGLRGATPTALGLPRRATFTGGLVAAVSAGCFNRSPRPLRD